MTPELLKNILRDQKDERQVPPDYHQRKHQARLQQLANNQEIIGITGIRRCGKSVLLHYLRQSLPEQDYYLDFEDPRLAAFTATHFQMLYEVFLEVYGEQSTFYFDEIQNVSGWEMFVRRLYNAGNKIFITGSNATLFSEALGTRLTGRYMPLTVYPFSFQEVAEHHHPKIPHDAVYSTKDTGALKKLFANYIHYGGIPEYTKNHDPEYLTVLYDSVIYRDIVTRYKITNVSILKKLVFYLASNCGKEITYSALRKWLQLGSASTVSDYCGYLELSYLCFFVNRYSPSVKTQQLSPKKVYFIDHALAKTVGFRFSEDAGRLLENIVFIELKRRGYTIFYYQEKHACDFIVQKGIDVIQVIQVCQYLTNEKTQLRERQGLIEAMQRFSLQTGLILTEHETRTETLEQDGKTYQILIRPVWQWLLETPQQL